MISIVRIVALLCCVADVYAASVQGVVIDAPYGNAVTSAAYDLRGVGDPSFWRSGTVDQDGRFRVGQVPAGTYSLFVTGNYGQFSEYYGGARTAADQTVITLAEDEDFDAGQLVLDWKTYIDSVTIEPAESYGGTINVRAEIVSAVRGTQRLYVWANVVEVAPSGGRPGTAFTVAESEGPIVIRKGTNTVDLSFDFAGPNSGTYEIGVYAGPSKWSWRAGPATAGFVVLPGQGIGGGE